MAVFSNTATLSYNNNIINSNTVTGELQEILSLSKASVGSNYKANDTQTFVVSVVNTGTTAFSNLLLTDNLGEYALGGTNLYPLTYVPDSLRYYVNGTLQTAPAPATLVPLSVSGINVPAGGNATIVYQATVNEYAPLAVGSQITNTATLSGTGITTALTDTATINAAEESILSITKTLCPAVVSENGTLNYGFTIQNYGNTPITATDNAVISDNFDPVLNNISVTFNSAPWAETTNYTYNAQTGAFATVLGQITVPAATYVQGADGKFTITPGVSILNISGTV